MEAHVVVNPDDTVEKAHDICTKIEIALKKSLGSQTQISLHIEPSEDADQLATCLFSLEFAG